MKLFKENWINQMTESLILATGCEPKKAVKFAEKKFDEKFTDHDVLLYNSYEEEVIEARLSETLDEIKRKNYIITESGTVFKPRKETVNLNADINAHQLDSRKVHKKNMYKYKQSGDVIREAYENTMQGLEKRRANSGYGAEGNMMSFLFNYNSASSVTASGRGQVSMAAQCYENLLSDAVKFHNMDEFFAYLRNIINEKDEWRFKLDEVISNPPSRKDLTKRMLNKFHKHAEYDTDIVAKTIDNLPDKMVSRIFFKSNIREFLLQKPVKSLYQTIISTKCEYMHPDEPPSEILAEVILFGELVIEFVNYKYQPFRYEDRAKHDKREVVIIMDTDSNILYYGDLFKYVIKNVLKVRLHRSKSDLELYEIKVLNVLSYISTKANEDVIDHYLGSVNVDEDIRYRIVMKNEYYMPTVIVTTAMKSYIAIIARQEGYIFEKPKLDVKGVSFFKSTSTAKTSAFIYNEILMDTLLMPKSGNIELPVVMKKINDYRLKMAKEIAEGDIEYFKKAKVKSEDAYKDPMSIGTFKACFVWNYLNPDNKVEPPSTVTLIKVKLFKKANLSLLEDFPEKYEELLELFETNEVIGKKGINTIALPYGVNEIPDWMIPIIDTETLVENNMKLFSQIFKPLKMAPTKVTHVDSRKQLSFYTNIIKI